MCNLLLITNRSMKHQTRIETCIFVNCLIVCLLIHLIVFWSRLSYRYPNPSAFTYERRLFCPFEYALQPPSWYKEEHIAVNKPEVPSGVSELKDYSGPQCFVIPGNHG